MTKYCRQSGLNKATATCGCEFCTAQARRDFKLDLKLVKPRDTKEWAEAIDSLRTRDELPPAA